MCVDSFTQTNKSIVFTLIYSDRYGESQSNRGVTSNQNSIYAKAASPK